MADHKKLIEELREYRDGCIGKTELKVGPLMSANLLDQAATVLESVLAALIDAEEANDAALARATAAEASRDAWMNAAGNTGKALIAAEASLKELREVLKAVSDDAVDVSEYTTLSDDYAIRGRVLRKVRAALSPPDTAATVSSRSLGEGG